MTNPVQRGRESWLLAGQELLRQGGINAVKLRALTTALGLTTGSFYHHFTNMAAYLDDLARYFGNDQLRANLTFLDDPDPRERLRHLTVVAAEERMVPLDAAMRDWAGSNPVAAEAVRLADDQVLRFIARAFQDLGHPRRSAQLRAQLLLCGGVARVVPPWTSMAGDVAEVLRILAP